MLAPSRVCLGLGLEIGATLVYRSLKAICSTVAEQEILEGIKTRLERESNQLCLSA
jgi:hypothetical protein